MNDDLNWKEEYLNSEGKMENGSKEQENLFFEKIAIQIREVVNHFKEDNKGVPRKANHAKGLVGFQNATFRILPEQTFLTDFHPGFFVPGHPYENVIVRFSNASAEIVSDDSSPDLRGVAIRIMANGIAHDFLMTNAEIHHAKDAREAMITIRSGIEKDIIEDALPDIFSKEVSRKIAGVTGALRFLVTHLGKRGAKILSTLREQMDREVQSLSTETYWSRAPLAIGNMKEPEQTVAVKYRLTPQPKPQPENAKPEQESITKGATDLTTTFMRELDKGEIRFNFEVQQFRNPKDTPIEDATISWGDESSFVKIAELIIEKDSKNEISLIDNRSFNPWQTDLDHFQPLGSMNRARKKVYPAAVNEREIESN